MVWGHHLQLWSLLPGSVTSSSLMSRWLPLIIPLFRRRWMSCLLREQLNHLLVVLVSILTCLWFLSILVVIILCIYFLLRCPLSDMSGRLFSMVIMLSPLIYRMLIYIFLLLSIIIISYNLFGIVCFISGRFYLLGWPQPLSFSKPSLNLFCSFAIASVSVLLSIWITSWSWFVLTSQVRGFACFCVPYWFSLDYILIFPSLTFASLRLFVSWGYVGILSACQYLYLLIS